MLQYMETVSQGEAENIRKTIQDLFRQTCILQVKCDPVTLVQRDNPRYQVCLRHREFIADYLSVLDCKLRKQSAENQYSCSARKCHAVYNLCHCNQSDILAERGIRQYTK